MNNSINCKNSNAKIEITYEFFMDRLLQIYKECRLEVYYAEIFMPLFIMCETDDAKIVPVYNNRRTGPRTDNETDFDKVMYTIRAVVGEDSVVPDYIYVSKDYSFDNPSKPYVIIETKAPIFECINNNYYYKKLRIDKKIENELRIEVQSCGKVILTDGITWMFWVWEEDIKLKEVVKLVDRINNPKEQDTFTINNKNIEVPIIQKEWADLICKIKEFLPVVKEI